jgi:hypothetical protein
MYAYEWLTAPSASSSGWSSSTRSTVPVTPAAPPVKRSRLNPPLREATWDKVTIALQAIVRWLHRNGAVSPLLGNHFAEGNLVPPSEQTAEALVAAKELEAWWETQGRARLQAKVPPA